jgi:CDP-diacylglycerol--serine O-phosphatidyltransferase
VFLGMPTTLAGGLVGLLLLVGMSHELDGLLAAMPLVALAFALMMVSNLPLPKIGKRGTKIGFYFQGLNLVLSYICGVTRMFPEYMLAVAVGYALVGFAYGQLHRNELLRRDGELEPQPT